MQNDKSRTLKKQKNKTELPADDLLNVSSTTSTINSNKPQVIQGIQWSVQTSPICFYLVVLRTFFLDFSRGYSLKNIHSNLRVECTMAPSASEF